MSATAAVSGSSPAKFSGLEWVKICLRGVGQVMFQENALTGLLFLAGIALAGFEESWPVALWMAFGGLVGAVLGTVTAWVLKYDEKDLRAGIYGFNSCLVGIANYFFFEPSMAATVMLVLGSIAGTIVTWAMRKFLPFPTYTFPFIVTTWVIVGIATLGFGLHTIAHPAPELLETHWTAAFTEGLSEVMFQASIVTGLFFLAGLAVSDWRHAVLGLLGSVVGTLAGVYHNDPHGAVSIGIFGYNAALAAIAMDLPRKALLLPILAAILSTPITDAFGAIPPVIPGYALPALTAPFVFACWLVILLQVVERYFAGQAPKRES